MNERGAFVHPERSEGSPRGAFINPERSEYLRG